MAKSQEIRDSEMSDAEKKIKKTTSTRKKLNRKKRRKKRVYRPIVIDCWGGGYEVKIPRKFRRDIKSMQHLAHQMIDYLASRRMLEKLAEMLELHLGVSSGAMVDDHVTDMISNTIRQQELDKKLKAAHPKRKKKKSVKSKRTKLKK